MKLWRIQYHHATGAIVQRYSDDTKSTNRLAQSLRECRMTTKYYRDLLCYEAMGTLRAMAAYRPEDLTDHALRVVRDYDHVEALDDDRRREAEAQQAILRG